jgi:hypothetical protein
LFNYEVNNNNGHWSLANMPLSLPNNASSYLDAGIVIDVGPASSFSGITATGTGTPLLTNVWIADGSDTYTLGERTGSNFCFGSFFGSGAHSGTFQMTGTCPGTVAGSYLSPSDIQLAFAGYEAYAWVGLANGGTGTELATITAVNGTPVNATVKLDSTGAAVTSSSPS